MPVFFPISKEKGKEAGFFAHYDVLAQRPTAAAYALPRKLSVI